jgi:two-component system cell cycle sensor histidine kinase PleC
VMRDISQTLNLNKQLMQLAEDRSRQAEKAQEANKAKTTFLATMSHELRTPLNAIIGFSEFMQTEAFGPLGNAKYREYVDDILKSGRQLLEIINDILDLSKVEAGAYRFNPEIFTVAPIIRAVRDVAVPMLLEKNLDLIVECSDKLKAYADKRATRQILVNLISNAIKFTPRGGRISIRAQMGEKADMVEFRISDTGCGISAENLERIWQPFVQVGDAYRAEVKGTGLGLAISRSFAEGMRGDIRIESQFGVGTTVILRLPVSAATPSAIEQAG